jgi:hypothetical protein
VPKVRPKGVTDGQQVNIPALPKLDKDRWGDADRKPGGAMVSTPGEGRSGEANPPGRLPGKASKESQVTVPQTDTGGRDEYSKALG